MRCRDGLIKLRDAVRAGEAVPLSFICLNAESHRQAFRAYNGSLDAAKSLHEAVLQNHQWHISNEANGDGYVCSIFDNKRDRYTATTHQPCPARAWLLAILEALIVQEPAPMTQEGGE